MQITYIHHTRFPTERAHGYQVAEVCHALASLGHAVTLLVPTMGRNVPDDAHAYYGLPRSFSVVRLPSFNAQASIFVPGILNFTVGMWSYRKALRCHLHCHQTDLLYTRSPSVLPPLLAADLPVILELHTLPRFGKSRFVRLCCRCHRVVCLTSLMRDELARWGVPAEKMIVEGDAVSFQRFAGAHSVHGNPYEAASGKPVICYIGSLTSMRLAKGITELIDALSLLKKSGVSFYGAIVGGPEHIVPAFRSDARQKCLAEEDCTFPGLVASCDVARYLSHADILVYPAPLSRHPYFLRDTSPLKIFEYMAADKPIVASDLPPLRDVLDESVVFFCRPGDSADLARAIREALSFPDEAKRRAECALERVQEHTWEKRMERILSHLSLP